MTAAGVTAAGISAAVMPGLLVMTAIKIGVDREMPRQQRFDDLPDVARRAADHLNIRRRQRVERTAADAAANEDFDIAPGEKPRQRAVPRFAAEKSAFGDDLAVFHFKYRKFRRMPEMLKNFIVFASHCNFHFDSRQFTK